MSDAGSQHRICHIELDEKSIIRRNADIDHERRVAIFDLLEKNHYEPVEDLPGQYQGPFKVRLRMEDNRLAMIVRTEADQELTTILLPLSILRKTIKEYFQICDSYFAAIKSASPRQIETIDMARRSLHNEGSEILLDRLAEKVKIDFHTARRLFTLICVLQIR
ncbi:UPF0262 family protein [Paremcibacter congregatus]|uniref:Uncharacterized protein n=1 Tax=Paremcibacter congregatus TaxID=2043170 RepID=A0A2G4YMD2_9PROT|nr:UPF0262 family protein [Paremcibacter congregatus]PHZ83465.1 hypothetical protein CRD36_18075 [Paremcibacter congregatus]QDE28068.1 UPF0262 family protein [Paremcibacter congregatus]|tara:strand:- start:3639 stop:4130 length:492 start_codon:yes stop_codon:yes gene_type:complete